MDHLRTVLKYSQSIAGRFKSSAIAQGLRTLKVEDVWGRSRREGTSVMGISSKSYIKTQDV